MAQNPAKIFLYAKTARVLTWFGLLVWAITIICPLMDGMALQRWQTFITALLMGM